MSTPENRTKMAAKIVDFEARRDPSGRIKVYNLPAGDGGGEYEVAGINNRHHPQEAARLRDLVESGRYQEAEQQASSYVASYTDAADRWTPHTAVESYLRDCIFNRGPGGAAAIYQMALGVRVDRDIGPISRAAGESVIPADFLRKMRSARERYEREVVGRNETSPFWRGLVNRWNNAMEFASGFLSDAPDAPQAAVAYEPRPGSMDTAPSGNQVGHSPAASGSSLNIRVLNPALPSRSRTVKPTLVVLHATAGASARSSIEHLRGEGLSYHYIIARDGKDSTWTREADGTDPVIFHCVADDRHAFHVGSTIPAPSGEGSINKCSIGISLANLQAGGEPYTPGQLAALRSLLFRLKELHPSLSHLTDHASVQPWNRSDPRGVDTEVLARELGLAFFRPTADQIREHRK